VRLRNFIKLLLVAMLLLVVISIGSASTASVTVPPTRLEDDSRGIAANDLKPAICAALNLTAILTCPPNCTGTAASELILGSTSGETLYGGGGDDCILGGGGTDLIYGDGGTDVCDGGPGFDLFLPFFSPTCETRIQ
jgi:Ca2+-binding RTX toxin-like protein